MNYNEMHLHSDRSNDRSTRYPSPISPMDSLIASCSSFDLPHTPSLQDSPALPSYRVQFGPELSLLDDNDRTSNSFGVSMAESFSMTTHDSTASFPLSIFDGNVFPEDTYAGQFGPMLVANPTSELSSWTPRSIGTRENAQAPLCFSPYAMNTTTTFTQPRDGSGEYSGRASFEMIPGESSTSSETDSMPRTPETVAPSAAFSNITYLMDNNHSQRKGSSSWSHTMPGSASSAFLEEECPATMWKVLSMKSKPLSSNVQPMELRASSASTRRSQISKRKRTNTRTQPDRAARSDAALNSMTYGIPLEHISKPTSRCDECNQNFQRPEHLTRHKKSASHTRATPFECELPRCLDKKTGRRKCFNRQDNKTAHIVKTHLTRAAKGRRDRVTKEEAVALGWEKYFLAATKEQKKQDEVLQRQSRTTPSSNTSTTSTNAASAAARITKKAYRRQVKALR